MTASPGTWHCSDPTLQVQFQVAKTAWAKAAAQILENVASTYGDAITYQDLKDRLFEVTGYRTRMLIGNWIGGVLGSVQDATLRDGRPPLSALVVRSQTGGVGDGYINHEHPQGFSEDAERQKAAAEDRLTCYRHFGRDLPNDAKSQMTELWTATKAVRAQPTPAPVKVCPKCFMALPASGVCDCG